MSNPYFWAFDPSAAPPAVTPGDSPSSPEGFAGVTPHGPGPAPYDIQAPLDQAAIQAAYDGAGAASAAGISAYPRQSPRQAAAEAFLSSPQGYGELHITEGFSGEPGESWPNSVDPGGNAMTPDQGTGDFTGTGTD